ncbi:MAG: hypothetical protein IJR08_01735 [Bacilli bacterium]|nr:hypothetical protein [Bacilli bacterium]
MEKIKNFFKGKKIPYFIMMADCLLAIILGIYFLATKNISLANSASTHRPEWVWIFAFAGAIFEVAALIVPKYRWVHLFAIAGYALSFMKELELIPPVSADMVTGVHFQGGNFFIQLSYVILQVIIIASAIYVAFTDSLTEEGEQAEPKLKEKKGIIKAGAAGVVGVVGLVFALVLVFSNSGSKEVEEKVYNPVEAFRDLVVDYENDPLSIKYQQGAEDDSEFKNPYEGASSSDVNSALNNRNDTWVVYEFEGKYTEAYHDQYNYNYYNITVYADGLYSGSNNQRGYWYNINEDGIDCLVLKATSGNDMVCRKADQGSPYMWFTDLVTGNRTCKMSGYPYYPIIGIYIDTNGLIKEEGQVIQVKKDSEFSRSDWSVMVVRNNLSASAVFRPEQVTWTDIDTSKTGEQSVKAKWNDFEAEVKVEVI